MSKSSVAAQLNQNTTIDQIAAGVIRARATRSVPLSLKPDQRIAFGCVLNDRNSILIRDSWHFREPVTIMPVEQFDDLVERCHVEFHGLDRDVDDSASIAAQEELEADFNG